MLIVMQPELGLLFLDSDESEYENTNLETLGLVDR